MGAISVIVADDDPVIREVLTELIESYADFDLAGVGADADEAVQLAILHRPDVAVIDVRMPGGGGPSATARIREVSPSTTVVGFSAYDDRGALLEMIRAGAVGYVVKGGSSGEIIEAIRHAARTESKDGGAVRIVPPKKESQDPIRVIVIDDDQSVCDALGELCSSEPSLSLEGTAVEPLDGVRLAAEVQPDVALVDVKMTDGGGPEVTRRLRRVSPNTKVAGISVWTDKVLLAEMLRAGATGYVVKGSPTSEIVETIQRTHRGSLSVSADAAKPVMQEIVVQLQRESRDRERKVREIDEIIHILNEEAFVTVYQPIADITTGHIVGVEALTRFPGEHQEPPNVWFKRAADNGMRGEMEIATLRRALAGVRRFPSDVYATVNVSAEMAVTPEFLELLAGDLGPRLVVEISESEPVEDYTALAAALKGPRANGVRLAIDDAGLGYSLNHMLQMQPDIIKLDIALVRDIDTDRARGALAAALVTFADQIGATLVAEGIERREEADRLLELGIRYGQGYYFARPTPNPFDLEATPASIPI